ncbi:unnamed protein product [Blepharisma stoltei]|uniref:C2H2-type domain-containing protein n=1 Tax=Blepharisma stoltei TaxID=1481888 RepID=A0AAU9K181_9CILI|nr:unnamed protein product [Blepharisma stoltei]
MQDDRSCSSDKSSSRTSLSENKTIKKSIVERRMEKMFKNNPIFLRRNIKTSRFRGTQVPEYEVRMEKRTDKFISKRITGLKCTLCNLQLNSFEALVFHYYSLHTYLCFFDMSISPHIIYLFLPNPTPNRKNIVLIDKRSLLIKITEIVKRYNLESTTIPPLIKSKIEKNFGKQKDKKPKNKNMSKRIYFHSITGEPFDPNEIQVDSEEEINDEWIRKSEEKEINSYENMNIEDKEFFKLWNSHIHDNYKIPADFLMKDACLTFIEKYQLGIASFRTQLTLHIITMWDYNILTGDDMLYIMQKLLFAIENQ